jgi:hypothetical protein
LPRVIFLVLVGWVVLLEGCATPNLHQIMRQNFQAPQRSLQVLAVYMPWFGDPDHINVGYSSQDTTVLRRQIQEARGMGISAFVVDWYGDRSPFLDKSFAILEQVAQQEHFHVALMYDESNTDEATGDTLAALEKAYKAYVGPQAPYRNAYLTYQGRPMIFIFPKQGRTNWDRVRTQLSAWPTPPLLFYKDVPSAQFTADFDGFYPWVHPGKKGWSTRGDDWGKQYLENFYETMQTKYRSKIEVGAAWPGFNDAGAKWGLNRYMDARCGKTFEETLQLFRHYDDDSAPLPFLLVETWNDYEEGTAIERSQFADCTNQNRPTSSVGGQ